MVSPEASEYLKKHLATLANLEAAKVCNHKRTIPKTWSSSLERQRQRLKERQERAKKNIKKYRQKIKDTQKSYSERMTRYEKKLEEDEGKLKQYLKELKKRESEGRSTKGIKKRIASKRKVMKNSKSRLRDTKKKLQNRLTVLRQNLEKRRIRDTELIEKTNLQIKTKELTRDYNLNTSLKSYIDPRIFHTWCKKVDYDWRNYYPKTLQKKFSWVENVNEIEN
jgi:DNA topoisomerase-1